MRVLVTGGLGVVGSHIARRYLDAGHQVRVLDAAEEKRNRWIARQLLAAYPDIEIWPSRIETMPMAVLDRMLDGVDKVVHAAASTGIPHSTENANDDWASNVDATKVILDALRRRPTPTVMLSSVKPYQLPDRPAGELLNSWEGLSEDDPLVPDEPYAASKAAQSMLAMAWARSYDLPVAVLRCSNLYGPAPCHGPRHGWLTWFCISAAIGRPLEVQGSGRQARDMLHAADVHAACEASFASMDAVRGRVFNIGGGRPNVVHIDQVAQQLASATGAQIVRGPGRRHEDQVVFADHRRFTRATGWEPKVPVRLGLLEVLKWAQHSADDLRRVYEGV